MRIPVLVAAALALAACPAPAPRAPAPGVEPAPVVPDPDPGPAGTEAPEDPADDRVLVLDGTPPIPDELRARVGQYLETRSASLQDMSADGGTLLVSTRFAEISQLHLVAQPLGARRQLTFGAEPASSASFVPGRSREIVYMADIGGNEQAQIYHLDLATGRSRLLTDGQSRTVTYRFSHDGAQMAFASNRRNGRDFDIWVSDGRSQESARQVLEVSGYYYPLDWSRDKKKLLVGEYRSINDSRVHLLDVGTGEVTQVSPPEPVSAYRDALLARDGKRAYVTSDREGEFVELWEVELAAGAWRPLSRAIPWNVEQMALSADGRTLAFTTNEGGLSRLKLLDTRTRKTTAVPSVPAGVIRGLSFSRDRAVIGFTLNSATRPGDAYTYDPRTRRLTRWTESEVGGLDPATFVEPEIITYKSFDDLEVPAFYYRPPGDGPFPVVVDIHGGPEAQARPFFSPRQQYLLVEQGVAVLAPNVRGSDGYGKTYLKLDNGKKREDSVKDIGALLDWIAARPELDESRVATVGGSYGGYMVLASLVHFGDRLRAGVNVVGISNFVTFLENTADYRRDLRRVEYGDERDPAMRAFLESISPLGRASEIRSALFVAQGANDPRVPASEAEQIVRAVRASGHDCWYMLARNEGHGFARKENRDTFLLLTVMFLEQHLAGN